MATQDAEAETQDAQAADAPANGYLDQRLIGHPSLMLAVLGQQAIHRIRDELSEHGLKPRQLQVLEFLAENDAVGQRELGEQLLIDHSILVTMLNPLEAEGLIERRRSCIDRRRHNVSITAAGRERQSEASASVARLEEQILEALPEAGRRQLAELLWTLMSAAQPQHGEEC